MPWEGAGFNAWEKRNTRARTEGVNSWVSLGAQRANPSVCGILDSVQYLGCLRWVSGKHDQNSSTLMGVFLAAAVALVLSGHLLLYSWLVYIFNPLATIFILSIAFTNWRNRTDSYSLWITTGLLCSLIGDVFLIWPSLFFLPGLFPFLLAHIAYLVAFTRDVKFPARPSQNRPASAAFTALPVCSSVGTA
jgi:hypothetical protein